MSDSGGPDGARRFWRTLTSVMAVQLAALIALWLIQRHFSI